MIKGLGTRIKELRLERDISIELLVDDMNTRYQMEKPLNKSMVSRWENEVNAPSLDNAKYLCDYFNVSLDYLIGLTDVRTPTRLLAKSKRKGDTK